jgi:hypothetical protein
LDCFRKACPKALRKENIISAWRGAGLIPMDEARILKKLQQSSTTSLTSTPEPLISSSTLLLTSSLPDATTLRIANTNMHPRIVNSNLSPNAQKHLINVSSLCKQLLASQTLLQRENEELKRVISGRKERRTGKQLALKDEPIISSEAMFEKIRAAENETKEKKKRGRKRRHSASQATEVSIVDE